MESNQDSTALAQQIQALAATVEELTGRITVLNKFISKATDKCLPFFKTLKQAFS